MIIPRLFSWHSFYTVLRDPLGEGKSFFATKHTKIFCKEMNNVSKGYLSGRPGLDCYIRTPTPFGIC